MGIIAAVLVLIIIPAALAVFIYESNFGSRYTSYGPRMRSADEFEGLDVKNCTFVSGQGQQLAGYIYSKNGEPARGIIVMAHGLGGGGHNSYMDVADYFASRGYFVFAYDVTGNDESEGDSVRGLPQGIIDLDYAIRYVKQNEDWKDLPVMLFGHSWGGYSVGSVLCVHPDMKAVVSVSGFNKSMDMIRSEGEKIIGKGIGLLIPYVSAYEHIKFGKYASYTCMDGFSCSDAGVMILHSEDDDTVPVQNGIDIYYKKYADSPRFRFIRPGDRGHNYVYYSQDSMRYRDTFYEAMDTYGESLGDGFTPEKRTEYMEQNLDKKAMFDLDQELMERIADFYDSYN